MRGLIASCAVILGLGAGFLAADDDGADVQLPKVVVRLEAAEEGKLSKVIIGRRNLGNSDTSFERLNAEILQIIGKPTNPLTSDLAVVLFVGPDVKFTDASKAISACSGRKDEKSGKFIRYIRTVHIVTSEVELKSVR